ncbi:heparan sulfate glucosamine 3-O-sulfotransferase 1-like [Glandiceps talaboti]
MTHVWYVPKGKRLKIGIVLSVLIVFLTFMVWRERLMKTSLELKRAHVLPKKISTHSSLQQLQVGDKPASSNIYIPREFDLDRVATGQNLDQKHTISPNMAKLTTVHMNDPSGSRESEYPDDVTIMEGDFSSDSDSDSDVIEAMIDDIDEEYLHKLFQKIEGEGADVDNFDVEFEPAELEEKVKNNVTRKDRIREMFRTAMNQINGLNIQQIRSLIDNTTTTNVLNSCSLRNIRKIKQQGCAKRLPQVIGIGVKKCGTGAFNFFLKQHPSISSRGSEVHYFDRDDRYNNGLDWYQNKMPFSSKDQLTMEKSPKYFVRPYVPKRIHDDLSPNTKLVLVTCNPVKRAISDFVHESLIRRKRRRKHIVVVNNRTTDYIIRDTFEESVIKDDGTVYEENHLINVGIYVKHLQNWLKYFPLEQIHVVDAEIMKTDPYQVMREIETFLSIPQYFTRDHFYYDEQTGYYCAALPKKRCLPKSKRRHHPQVREEVVQKLKEFYSPYNNEMTKLFKRRFLWMDR